MNKTKIYLQRYVLLKLKINGVVEGASQYSCLPTQLMVLFEINLLQY